MAIDAVRAKSLFLAASDLADLAERAAYLDRECGGDAELRDRVEALLRANDASPLPSAGVGNGANAHISDRLPETEDYGDPTARVGAILAGKYKLIEAIGEGGMGSVYLAQQTEPVKRAVAVKVIKAGMDSKAVLVRFEAERQALAMMDHPNIAKVLDAGTTDGGRPFFVMELVKGVKITQFCDERKLTPRQRLDLFVPVCQAIQHAHQKGVIHRDIKPSNVLIALYDDRPVPKVIDFGVAKAAGQTLTDKTLMTGFGAVVGTPEYMSPEQANLNNQDIDTRSDVYSLGVLLYELLTGTTPMDRKSLGKAALLEILRIVREVEAPRPSAKLSTIDTLPSVAANRGTEPAKLSKLMKGELDWVLLKALEKDRTRRYDTANGLARDIQRYLADEIVEARPPSTGYRLKKFVRRHKGQVIAASLVLVALLAGMAGTTWGLIEARRQEGIARAETVEKEQARAAEAARAEGERLAKLDAQAQKAKAEQAAAAEKAANEQAQKRLRQIEKANDILGSIFENLDPKEIAKAEQPLQAILVEKLNKAVAQLEGESIGDPLVVAAMQVKFGSSLLGLGEPGKAIVLLEKARATHQARLGPEHPDTLQSMNNLAAAYWQAKQLDKSIPLFEETLKLKEAKLGRDHPETLLTVANLGVNYKYAGRLAEAVPLLEEALKLRKAKLGPEHPNTLITMNNLGKAYGDANQGEKAAATFKEFVAGRRKRAKPDDPEFAGLLAQVALELSKCRQHTASEELLRECLAIREKKEPDVWTTFNTKSLLGGALQGQKKYADAEPLLLAGYEGIKQREKTIPEQGKVRLPEALDRLIELYTATNKPDEVKKWQAERAKYPEAAPPPREKK